MELWDAYDKNEVKLDFDLIRGESIPDNVYHIVCDTIVCHQDGDFLLMQRALDKEGWPGFWEAGAGGSALKGETPPECAKRELLEECGIKCDNLVELYHTIREGGHAIHHGYLCITDCPKDAITLQKGETIAYKWVTKKDFIAYMNSNNCIEEQRERLKDYIKSLEKNK